MEPKGPIGRQVWPTNQLWKEDIQRVASAGEQYYTNIRSLRTSYLSILLDHLIWPWTKEEIEVQYPTNGPIGDGRVGL